MDLLKLAQQAQEELDKEKKELQDEKVKLVVDKKSLIIVKAEYAMLVKQLEEARKDLEVREEAVKQIEDLKELQEKASNDINAVATARAELREREAKLLEIQNIQKAKEEELTKREFAVSEREENYKETLKEEFSEMVRKKFS